jgi:hypothetical protein
VLALGAHSWWPGLFDSAKTFGALYAGDPLVGVLIAAAPFMVMAALPAWWLLGGLVLWLDRRRGKDIGELAVDWAPGTASTSTRWMTWWRRSCALAG